MIPKYYKGTVAGTNIGAGGNFVVVRQLEGSKEVLLPARNFDSNRAGEVIWWDSSSMSSVKIAGMNRGVPQNWGYGEPPAGNRDRGHIENISRDTPAWDPLGGLDGDDFDLRMGWARRDQLPSQKSDYGTKGPRSPFPYDESDSLRGIQTAKPAPTGSLSRNTASAGHGQESIDAQLLRHALEYPGIQQVKGLSIYDPNEIYGHLLHFLIARNATELNGALDSLRMLEFMSKFDGAIYRSLQGTIGETVSSEQDFRPHIQENQLHNDLLFVPHPEILTIVNLDDQNMTTRHKKGQRTLQRIVNELARLGFH